MKKVFIELETNSILSEGVFCSLEVYVCHLYGFKEKSVDFVREEMFRRKEQKEHKFTDFSMLPPCNNVLRYNARRSNYLAYIRRNATSACVDIPNIRDHG